MKTGKDLMMRSLPLRCGNLNVRNWIPDDLTRLAAWPSYPFPYEPFNLRYRQMDAPERAWAFQTHEANPARLTLVADNAELKAMAYHALAEIDWESGIVGNMSFRVHPLCCGQGIGAALMQAVADWCFEHGLSNLRLDVAASNARAVRCYEKSGFAITGEFWRDDLSLSDVPLTESKYDFLRPHVRWSESAPQLRFYLMALSGPCR